MYVPKRLLVGNYQPSSPRNGIQFDLLRPGEQLAQLERR